MGVGAGSTDPAAAGPIMFEINCMLSVSCLVMSSSCYAISLDCSSIDKFAGLHSNTWLVKESINVATGLILVNCTCPVLDVLATARYIL